MGALDAWKEEIDEPIRKARQNVEDWHARFGGELSGFVRVGGSEETAEKRIVGDPILAERIEQRTRLPIGVDARAMFAERDRLRELAAECGDIMPSISAITVRAVATAFEYPKETDQ